MQAAHTVNAFTVDVEDWVQSVLDPDAPLTGNFVPNTHRILDLLDKYETKATFFVLGLAAEKAPMLVREIHARGHEVQSHGYGHRLVHMQTPREFRADIEKSKKMLEDLTGSLVCGYRAPAFSITKGNLWALDALVDAGFTFDSSINPAKTSRYGIAGAPRFLHKLRTPNGREMIEIPVASYRAFGKTIPLGGGGYFRLFPFTMIRRTINQLHRLGHPATIYCHPYEFNPNEIASLDRDIPLRLRLHQGLGRRGFVDKIAQLLSTWRFGSIRDVLENVGELPYERSPGISSVETLAESQPRNNNSTPSRRLDRTPEPILP
jgi:polysaccharide deacetylase family protein (PEP-CTERM system associated)